MWKKSPKFALPGTPSLATVKEAFAEAEKKVVRDRILNLGKRPDGRTPTEIRPIWCEVGFSPRAHGSGLFTRGETQVLTLATLGTLRESQEIGLRSARSIPSATCTITTSRPSPPARPK